MPRTRMALKRPAPAASGELETPAAAEAAGSTPPSSDISDNDVEETTVQFSDEYASSDADVRDASHPRRRAAEAKEVAAVVEALKRDHR